MKVNTVCMTLVASRNLTTLFASCCMLHPDIQVLNHFPSINSDNKTNFLVDYTDDKLNNFVNKVDQINKDQLNKVGEGGIITTDHAFSSNEGLRNAFHERFSSEHKKDFKSIVWKDSPRNTLLLQKINMDGLLAKTDKLRFVLIVRNPMDCATSSSAPGYNQRYRLPSKEHILSELFERYEWFFDAERKHPGHFMSFFEFDPDYELVCKLQNFLMIDNDEQWKNNFLKFWVMKRKYNHTAEFKKQYHSLIKNITDEKLQRKFKRYL
ncbi:MAG: hypothetical protein Q8P20_09635 [bacterium]|nr:hypothetical protein [bacterium]